MRVPITRMSMADDSDLVRVRRHVRIIAQALSFSASQQTKIATAVSEVARNSLQYAEGGWLTVSLNDNGRARCLEIVCADEGPGIRDVDQVMSGRYRSTTGLGIGLAGAKRLVGEMEVESGAGGTRVTLMEELPPGARGDLAKLAEMAADTVGRARHQDPVDELMRQNRELLSSLADKEFLIREIHHRVKNNFQLISSLIRLQSRSAKGTEAADLLQSLAGRIQAMALAHERFYRDEDVARVNLRDFLTDLGNEVTRAFVPEDREIDIKVDVEDVTVGQEEGISIGLIVNELLTNACKHAFPAGRDGEIEVTGRMEQGDLIIKVADNGVGKPAEAAAGGGSLGTKVIESTARRLAAEVSTGQKDGVEVTVRVPMRGPEGGGVPV